MRMLTDFSPELVTTFAYNAGRGGGVPRRA
jgi:hypothetical protein